MLVSSLAVVVAVGMTVTALSQLSVTLAETYGWALFVLGPMGGGAMSVLLVGRSSRLTAARAIGLSAMTALTAGLGFLVVGLEGLICLLYAAPLTVPCAIVGGLAAFVASRGRLRGREVAASVLILAAMGLAHAIEPRIHGDGYLRDVSTTVEVDAGAAEAWELVVAFPPIDHAPELPFQLGIAYPTHATIEGTGVGAVRRCEFSTGGFVEPITVWDPPRRLEFSIIENPPTMVELTFHDDVIPAHTTTSFESTRGRFLLTASPTGGTRLTGTTWYRQALWPEAYWGRVSDDVVHRIHRRVLEHIRATTEASGRLQAMRMATR